MFFGGGGWDRTSDLQVMSLTSYHCSTPQADRVGVEPTINWLTANPLASLRTCLFSNGRNSGSLIRFVAPNGLDPALDEIPSGGGWIRTTVWVYAISVFPVLSR